MVTRSDLKELGSGASQLAKSINDAHTLQMKAEQDAAIKKQQQAEEIAAAKGLLGDNPKSTVKVGDISINPNEGGNLLEWLRMQNLQSERTDKKVQGIADRVNKEGLPETRQALRGVDNTFTGASVTPVLNSLPEMLQGPAANMKGALGKASGGTGVTSKLAGLFGIKPEDANAGQEFQELQRLMNIDVRNFAGAAQTKFETGRKMTEQGRSLGGTPDMVRRGIEMMREGAAENARNIAAGSDPEALKVYEKQYGAKIDDGLLPNDRLKTGSAGTAPPPITQLRVKHKVSGQMGTLPSNELTDEFEVIK